MTSKYVTDFCTPPYTPASEREIQLLKTANTFTVPFENNKIPCYGWGEGKTIVLVHGWSSRASHWLLLARTLVSAGYHVVAFDAPAHSSVNDPTRKSTSNLFEFSRAVSAVANNLNHVYAIIGHSLGAAAAAFSLSSLPYLSAQRNKIDKLILISTPVSVATIILNFSKRHELDPNETEILKQGLEHDFQMHVDQYHIKDVLTKRNDTQVMVIHDRDDDQFPCSDVEQLSHENNHIHLKITEKLGHSQILTNRKIFKGILEFLNN